MSKHLLGGLLAVALGLVTVAVGVWSSLNTPRGDHDQRPAILVAASQNPESGPRPESASGPVSGPTQPPAGDPAPSPTGQPPVVVADPVGQPVEAPAPQSYEYWYTDDDDDDRSDHHDDDDDDD